MSDLGESHAPSGAMPGLPYERRRARDEIAQRLAAIVESSDDAILAKDLDGTITSWNRGAERLFGYRAAEIVGKSVMLLMQDDRQDDEAPHLARLRRGERVRHSAPGRRRKEGERARVGLGTSVSGGVGLGGRRSGEKNSQPASS